MNLVVNTPEDAIVSYARQLRQSGSDVVAESDLAKVFGRCKISSTLSSSFKTLVTQSNSNVSLLEGIMLQGGPGPTVTRAFRHSAYFAMVVQLSFLAWAFDCQELATVIADALRNRLEGDPSQSALSSTPDMLGILGVLHACELQTSAFDWNMMLDAVSVLLGYEKNILLRIISEPDEEDRMISSVRRVPARGYGITLFEDHIRQFFPGRKETKAIIQELQQVTFAFAIIIARNLDKLEAKSDINTNVTRMRNGMKYYVNEDRLLQALRFLFDNAHLSHEDIDGLVAKYSGRPLQETLPQPAALKSAAQVQPQTPSHDLGIEDNWHCACAHARDLSILAISLAHVTNPEDCGNLKFFDVGISSIREVALGQQLQDWNGRDALRITDDAWLQALAVPLAGYRTQLRNLPWHNICLISDRGWSAWISTLAQHGSEQHDPEQIKAGSITLSRGSPCRNGVWKSAIYDPSGSLQSWTNPNTAESYGQVAHLRCAKKVTLEKPDCSEGVGAFFVSARLRRHEALPGESPVMRIGYKKLERCLWMTQLSEPCGHGGRRAPADVKLGRGFATVAGFGHDAFRTAERILICLTAHS
ncbi:MAG: hypothetical protein Q9212_006524, partial [Teloschistes hypoglaucus]